MRIAWATPFNDRSSIAKSSLAAAQELCQRGHAVEIVRIETGEAAANAPIPTSLPVHPPGTLDAARLRDAFDATVVAVGDKYPFHGRALPIIEAVPSIVVLHDADMRHLFAGAVEAGVLSPASIAARRAACGMPAADGETIGLDLPWISAMSIGAVAHAGHYAGRLDRRIPHVVIPLGKIDPGVSGCTREPDGRFVVTTFGMLNPNKQADRVLQALSRAPALWDRTIYRLVGLITDSERERLTRLAEQLGLPHPDFLGWVEDDRLQALLGETDVVCCLRHPVLEGASGSLIFALYSARPTIVADAGSYAEVPDGLVWKVSYGSDADDVAGALQTIAGDAVAARTRAHRAREWACSRHSPKAYIDDLLPFILRCVGSPPPARAMLPG
jgi:glycosyltransferase involved in cell wall biosynthesis